MKVLIVAPGEDTGGVGVGIVNAFRRHAPENDVRFVRKSDNYIKYPKDIEWLADDGAAESVVRTLWEQADVIHFFQKWAPGWGWDGKRLVIHHHGTAFRRAPDIYRSQAKEYGAKAITSTMDLFAIAPDELEWLPNPYNLDELARIRREHYVPGGPLRIAHAPTIRGRKSTDAFLDACSRLAAEKLFAIELIENVSWDTCLRRKAMADIYYDQVFVGYGNNAIEAWAMGIPVVAGVDPPRAEAIGHPIPADTLDVMKEKWGRIPFVQATEETIYQALKMLIDPEARAEYAQIGLEHVRRWHADNVVVEQLKKVYG